MSAMAAEQLELRERMLTALRAAKKPLTLKNLNKQVKVKDDSLEMELKSAIDAREIHRWPDQRKAQCFWHFSFSDKAKEALLDSAGERALVLTELLKAAAKHVSGVSAKQLEPIAKELISERKFQQVAAPKGSSKLLIRAGDRQAYLNAARAFVDEKLRAAGFQPDTFELSEVKEVGSSTGADAGSLILDAIRSLEPVHGVPVSTLRLRNHLRALSKEEFDTAALHLRDQRQVILSQHVNPYNAPPEEKAMLIDGKNGSFYVGIALY